MKRPTPEQLVKRAQNGDQAAAEKVVSQYRWLCQLIASSYFMKGSENDDVESEALLGLAKAMRDYRPGRCSFLHFAKTCIRRQVITGIKFETRAKHLIHHDAVSLEAKVTNSDDAILSEVVPSPAPEPFRVIENNRRARIIWEGKWNQGSLSDIEHQAVLGALEGYSYQEIGDLLGLEYKSVDNAIQRARRKLNEVFFDDAA